MRKLEDRLYWIALEKIGRPSCSYLHAGSAWIPLTSSGPTFLCSIGIFACERFTGAIGCPFEPSITRSVTHTLAFVGSEYISSWASLLAYTGTFFPIKKFIGFAPRVFGAITLASFFIEIEPHLALCSILWASAVTSKWIVFQRILTGWSVC